MSRGQGREYLAAVGAAHLAAHKLQPHRIRTFKRSRDPNFPHGWAREVTQRELPVATLAAVNMRLTPGGVREMHRHKHAEWAGTIGLGLLTRAADDLTLLWQILRAGYAELNQVRQCGHRRRDVRII
jgi:hypothetical protein